MLPAIDFTVKEIPPPPTTLHARGPGTAGQLLAQQLPSVDSVTGGYLPSPEGRVND